MNISLPNNWSPRDYQRPLWDYLGNGGKRAAVAWPRRHGKDDVMLHHNACSVFERVGNYWYMLPEYNQCRKAIWDAVNPHSGKKRIDEAFPMEIRSKTLSQEMKIEFVNGSTWQLMGSDNYNALVGSPPIGLTFSEYALSNPSSWGFLRPIMLENGGWAIFNSTPRGKNHFYKLMNMAKGSESWFSQVLTNDLTKLFTKDQLQEELNELISEHDETYGTALWLQEYFCSFDAALPGAIWAESMAKVTAEGRIKSVPHTPGYPVHSAWDMGYDDDTAIWFYQVIDDRLMIIDCFAVNFKDPDYFAEEVLLPKMKLGWRMGSNWLPHDAFAKKQGMGGKTIRQQFGDLRQDIIETHQYDIGAFCRVPNVSKKDGIDAARKTFKRCEFDSSTEEATESLKAYRRKYDEVLKTFSKEPVHDWSSHFSDAFRYLSLTWREARADQVVMSPEEKFHAGNIVNVNFGDMKKAHLKRIRAKREMA
jgi:phage terminase large subunit